MKNQTITRRTFLGRSAAATAAAAAPLIVPAHVVGKGVAPSDRITLGIIGTGGIGTGHLGLFLQDPTFRTLAVCDVYEPHRERAKNMVGKGCAAYNDYRALLDRNDIDAVFIGTPDHWHSLTSIHACQAGKDIYCEKPLALTIEEGRAMVDAVRRYGRVFQTGSQQRSEAHFRYACELVRNGYLGDISRVDVGLHPGPSHPWVLDSKPPRGLDWDLWLGPSPWVPYNKQRCIYNFRWFWDYSSGKMTDWGAHHLDIARWGLGYDETSGPIRITGQGTPPQSGMYETFVEWDVRYQFPTGVEVACSHRDLGVKFNGERGWIHVSRRGTKASDPELLNIPLKPDDVQLEDVRRDYGNVYDHHHRNWTHCMKTRQRPICDVEVGFQSLVWCLAGTIAMRLGRELVWDGEQEAFVNDAEANRWLGRPMRAPWHL